MASAAVELADLVLAERVLAVGPAGAVELAGLGGAGVTSSAGFAARRSVLARDVAQELGRLAEGAGNLDPLGGDRGPRRDRVLSSPSSSLRRNGSISVAHTSANGSARVLHVRAVAVADGIGPSCQVLAERSLMPAAAAAASNVCPCILLLLRTRTWRSVTIDLHAHRYPVGASF